MKDATGAQCEQWILLSDSGALRFLVSSRALLPMTPVCWAGADTAHRQHGHQLHGVRRIVVGWKAKRLGRDITGNNFGHGSNEANGRVEVAWLEHQRSRHRPEP